MTRIADDLTARWSICWATTYTFDPGFYETFLLRRLGDPPLNAVVLADFGRLAETWERMGPEDVWRIGGANRAYVIHPVSIAGAFHPKTLFLANRKEGVLLVGSGNLGVHGMGQGNEVFARFTSRDEEHVPDFAAWRGWMRGIVDDLDDALLRRRWVDVLERAPWLPPPMSGASFVTNWDHPLIDRLLDSIDTPVDALWATAPFFDASVTALHQIIERSRPAAIDLYLGQDASVDGQRLMDVVRSSGASSRLLRFEPRDFVHAKVIALVTGDRARVLAGSANLSAPALLHAVRGDGAANAEAGTIVDLPRERAAALFIPPEHDVVVLEDEATLALRFRPTSEEPGPPVRLTAAVREESGVASVQASMVEPGWALSDGSSSFPLSGPRTTEPVPASDVATLVWLVDGDEGPVSNRVPLTDPSSLARALHDRLGTADRPDELLESDLEHPLGRLLADLYQNTLFDIDEAPAVRRAAAVASERPDVDEEFWDRYWREELAQDPRIARYRTLVPATGLGADGEIDELGWLLRQMLDRVPEPNVLRLISGAQLDRETTEREGRKWTHDEKRAVRVYNVLHRYARVVNDSRARWTLSELAQVRHFEALLGLFAQIWVQREWLPEPRMVRLLQTLLGAFIRTDQAPGYLASLDEDERASALRALASGPAPGLAAGLTYAAVRDAPKDAYFEWQPYVMPGRAWGVFRADAMAVGLVPALCDLRPTAEQIEERIEAIVRHDDDAHWCARQAAILGFGAVQISKSGNPFYPLDLEVTGVDGTFTDPRLVTVVREALAYKGAQGIRLRSGPDVLTIATDKPMYGRIGERQIETAERITMASLVRLEGEGSGFDALLAMEGLAS